MSQGTPRDHGHHPPGRKAGATADGQQAEPRENARIHPLRRALSLARIPAYARYEAYMQELAADCQRLTSLGLEEGT